MKKIALMSLFLFSATSHAGWLIGSSPNGVDFDSSTVKGISSDWGNTGNFAVLTEGGAGPCINQWIVFSKEKMSPETYRGSFEIAQMAFIHGFKVNIFNYTDNSCEGAEFIELGRH